MERVVFENEWHSMSVAERLSWGSLSAETESRRLKAGIVESVDAAKYTAQLDDLLSGWLWSMVAYWQVGHRDATFDSVDGVLGSLNGLIRDSQHDEHTQNCLADLVCYLMDHAGSAKDHCLNLITGVARFGGLKTAEAMGKVFKKHQWKIHVAKALAWEFDNDPDSVCHMMLEWIMSAPGAGASLNGQVDSSNDGIADSFGWGLHFGPGLLVDVDDINDKYSDVLNIIQYSIANMDCNVPEGSSWSDYFQGVYDNWKDNWADIKSALNDLYTAIDKVAGNGYKPWPEPEAQGKLAILTPAQVMASIFGADVVIKEGA